MNFPAQRAGSPFDVASMRLTPSILLTQRELAGLSYSPATVQHGKSAA
jgi:hypothetical protein